MLVLFEKMALLVIILAIGYICAKIKLVGPEFNKGLSKMVINVFLAGMILASVMNKELSMSKGDMLFGIAMLFVMIFDSTPKEHMLFMLGRTAARPNPLLQ